MSLPSILEREPVGKSITIIWTNTHNSYGIAPKMTEPGVKPRIEVFNPCDESDDQKTSTCILFSDDKEFIGNYHICIDLTY